MATFVIDAMHSFNNVKSLEEKTLVAWMASKKASLGDLLSKILIWMLSMEVWKGLCLIIGEGPCL